MNDIRVLTFTHYGDTPEENARMTLSPVSIKLLAAYEDTKQGRPVKRVSVLFLEGDVTEIFVSDMDLLTIERAVGMYGTIEDY
jgi:hypothetical protein